MAASTTTVINGKTVKHGDTIISFRGEEFTFDHTEGDRIVTKERTTRFLHRVFVDVKDRKIDVPSSGPYAINDPKHPRHHDVMSDLADM